MVRKKWFDEKNIQWITVKEKIHIGKNMYILEKKKRPTLSYQFKKNQKAYNYGLSTLMSHLGETIVG